MVSYRYGEKGEFERLRKYIWDIRTYGEYFGGACL